MSLEEIKIAIEELANKIAKSSITPGIVANILEEIRLKVKDSIEKIDAMVGVIKSISILPSASSLKMILSKSDNSQQNVTIPAATKSTAGVMTSLDKTNLDYLTEHGATVRFDNAMSSSSENGVQNKVIKEYVDDMFDKTNILNVRMYDEVDPHFDNYSVVNIIDGTDIVATILMNTHSSGTKGIIFQNGSGWRIVTEELGDIIGAGWSQVLDDMIANSTPIGEGGGGADDTEQRLIAGLTPHVLYEDTDGNFVVVRDTKISGHNFRTLNIKKFICGTPEANGFSFFNNYYLEEIYPCFSGKFKSFNYTFEGCNALRKVDLSKVDFSQVTNFAYAFHLCNSITDEVLQSIDFENMADAGFEFAFYGCNSLVNINVNAPNCTSFNSTFYNTKSLKTAYINFSSKCTTITEMFRASSIERIDMSDADFSGITNMGSFGFQNQNLVSLIGNHTEDEVINGDIAVFRGLKVGWNANLYSMPVNLERASLLAIVKGIADLNIEGTSATLTFSTKEKNKLTSTEWQVAINKGWTIA